MINSQFVKALIKSKGLNQTILAKELGLSYGQFNAKINNRQKLWLYEAIIIANFLDFKDLDDFFSTDILENENG